jgi:LuxR family quorum sensing-dependent transcriptional regulator
MIEMSALDFVGELSRMDTVPEFQEKFEDWLKSIGFRYFVISGIPGPFDSIKQHIVINNLPPDWINVYAKHSFVDDDPIVKACMELEYPFLWSTITSKLNKNSRAFIIMEMARQYGVENGFCVPIHGINGYEAGVSLSGASIKPTEKLLQDMHMVGMYSFNRLKVLCKNSLIGVELLTRREKEILVWSALGNTSSQIAKTLNISETTVVTHIRNAMKKLASKNKVEAVITALGAGMISM